MTPEARSAATSYAAAEKSKYRRHKSTKPAANPSHHQAVERLNVALVGNPNVGKSVVFNAITGLSADVSNYPGTTIDVAHGHIGIHRLSDTPGVYGISSINDEECAARRMVLEADVLVNVVSALSLDRDLFLTMQLIDMGKPMLLVINQSDEARHRGISIDAKLLSTRLGIPVVECIAVQNIGIKEIVERLSEARVGCMNPDFLEKLQPLVDQKIDQARALLILEEDDLTIAETGIKSESLRHEIYSDRRRFVDELVEECVKEQMRSTKFSVKLGRFLLHPIYVGTIALLVCYLIFYQTLGVWIAGNLVDFTEKRTMRVYYEPVVRRLAAAVFPCDITIGDTTFQFPQGTLHAPTDAQRFDKSMSAVNPAEVGFNFWKYKNNFLSILGNLLV